MKAALSHTANAVVTSSLFARQRRRERVVVRARAAAERGDGDGGQHESILPDQSKATNRGAKTTTPLSSSSSPTPATTTPVVVVGRRAAIAGFGAAAASASLAPQAAQASVKLTPEGLDPSRRFFHSFPPLWEPYFGWGERVTVKRELVPGVIWSLEQEQALDILAMNVRTTVVKLKDGGLVVFSPQAPTEEFFRLLEEIGGPVKHVVLPTYALEHKVYVPAMSRRYPEAQVWVAPGVWSVPVDLPLSWLGINAAGTLGSEGGGQPPPPWANEIDCKVLRVDAAGANPYIEAVFFHKATRSLLVTDLVLSIPTEPPEVISRDRLLALAPDDPADAPAPMSDEALRVGWAKASLVVSFLGPSSKGGKPTLAFIDEVCRDWGGHLEGRVGSRDVEGEGGGKGEREGVGEADTYTGFNKIIAAHYASPVVAGAAELRRAFAFLDKPGSDGLGLTAEGAELPEEDMRVLLQVNDILAKIGLGS